MERSKELGLFLFNKTEKNSSLYMIKGYCRREGYELFSVPTGVGEEVMEQGRHLSKDYLRAEVDM